MSTTPAPPRLAYNVKVKLTNLGVNFQTPKRGSPDFDTLANTVGTGFSHVLSKTPGFHNLEVDDFVE